jgi:hypothetical protein
MESRESLETLGSVSREMQPDHATILSVAGATDETGGISPVDEPDRTVVEQQQVVGHLSNGWAARIVVPPYSQKKLVLGGRQASRLCLLLAPAFEMTQPGPQPEQTGIDVIR